MHCSSVRPELLISVACPYILKEKLLGIHPAAASTFIMLLCPDIRV